MSEIFDYSIDPEFPSDHDGIYVFRDLSGLPFFSTNFHLLARINPHTLYEPLPKLPNKMFQQQAKRLESADFSGDESEKEK